MSPNSLRSAPPEPLVAAALLFLTLTACAETPVSGLQAPPGFEVASWADEVPNARSMALGDEGTVFVGTRTDGRVFALRDFDRDGRADKDWILAEGLNMPNGVAFRGGALYVATSGQVLRYDQIEARLDDPPEPVIVAELGAYRHHGWRYIGFGPDGRLYVSMGAPCNVCDEPDFGTILRMNADGSGREVFARGVRNSVGFDWHPVSGELWFTDNGRDMLGDDLPPDELNRADEPGLHFGFPYCHGGDIPDPEFGGSGACADHVPPVQRLGPHVASLGLHFYRGDGFPAEYRHQAFIAEHGSWNRSIPIGYRISLVRLEDNRALSYEPFISGWLGPDGEVSGRPVDLLELPDGSLLVSDDHAGRIYRIRYTGI